MIMGTVFDPSKLEPPEPQPFQPPRSNPGWPFSDLWAPSRTGGRSREEAAAIEQMFATTELHTAEGHERRLEMLRERLTR
jgi:hypothetical protein